MAGIMPRVPRRVMNEDLNELMWAAPTHVLACDWSLCSRSASSGCFFFAHAAGVPMRFRALTLAPCCTSSSTCFPGEYRVDPGFVFRIQGVVGVVVVRV